MAIWINLVISVFAYYWYYISSKDLLKEVLVVSIQGSETAPVSNHASVVGVGAGNLAVKASQTVTYALLFFAVIGAIILAISLNGGFTVINTGIANVIGGPPFAVLAWQYFCAFIPVSLCLTLGISFHATKTATWAGFFGAIRVSRALS